VIIVVAVTANALLKLAEQRLRPYSKLQRQEAV